MSRRKRRLRKRRPTPSRLARQPLQEPRVGPDDEEVAIRIRDALWSLPRAILQMAEEARQRQRKARERQRAVFQSTNPTVAECIAPYTKDALSGMLDALEITGAKGALKAAMAGRIVQELCDSERLALIVARLTNGEREALYFVLPRRNSVIGRIHPPLQSRSRRITLLELPFPSTKERHGASAGAGFAGRRAHGRAVSDCHSTRAEGATEGAVSAPK